MKILNLFAGIGGNRTLWGDKHEITAIEYNQQIAMIYLKRFPDDKVIVGDAYEYLLNHFREYDFIWASPPCPTHSKLQHVHKNALPDLRLYSIIIFLSNHFYKDWVIENVNPYYKPIITPSFEIDHHLFWSNFILSDNFKFNRKPMHESNIRDLCDLHGVNISIFGNMERKKIRTILRNMVYYEIGKYILDSTSKQLTLEAFK